MRGAGRPGSHVRAVPARRRRLRREVRVTAVERALPGADVVSQRQRRRRPAERHDAEDDPPDAHDALQRSGSARSRNAAESESGETASATSADDRLLEEPLARSDGSAACSNDPFPVTNRRMNATSSGDGIEPDDVQRNPRAPVGDRRLADPVDIAAVVVEVADEEHRRVRAAAPCG